MQTFACQACGQPVYFENAICANCGATLGFLSDEMRLAALIPCENGEWRPAKPTPKVRPMGFFERLLSRRPAVPETLDLDRRYRQCANYLQHNVCNWMVPADSGETWCPSCRTNRTIPNLARPGNLEKWRRIERGKRRLVYGLMRLGLPWRSRAEDPEHGVAFDFLSSQDAAPGTTILTGHADRLITLDIDEADPVERERMRVDMNETYRTLVGHFRHEIGHYYWQLLIRDGGRIDAFRELFGDERRDYREALDRHYRNGPPADWQDRHISAYAAAHPWEDWAETWAHYLHIVDTLETAAHFGIEVERRLPDGSVQRADPELDPYTIMDFDPIVAHWLPIALAVNSLNRSMGLQDLYPFVLAQPTIDKLAYVHRTVREAAGR